MDAYQMIKKFGLENGLLPQYEDWTPEQFEAACVAFEKSQEEKKSK